MTFRTDAPRGPQGPRGYDGPRGLTGLPGARGEQGVRGPAGGAMGMCVANYGADLTGVDPSDAAFSALFADMVSTRQSALYIPAGNYRLNYPLAIPESCTLVYGDGVASMRGSRFYSGSGSRLLFYGPGDGVIIGTGANAATGTLLMLLEILGRLDTGVADPEYNDRGIHIYGAVDVVVSHCRVGGFKRQIVCDGSNATTIRSVYFDGASDGHGYQSTNGYYGDDSAIAIAVGSQSGTSTIFDFPVPVAANQISIQDCTFNNSEVGVYLQSGQGHTIERCAFEIHRPVWIQSVTGLDMAGCVGEGATAACVTMRYMGAEGSTNSSNVTIRGAQPSPHYPLIEPDADKPCGVVCLGVGGGLFEAMGGYNVFPVTGAGRVVGLFDLGGNRLPIEGASKGALCDGYTVPQSPEILGVSLTHGRPARALLDASLYTYAAPLEVLSSEDYIYYQRNAPSSANGPTLTHFTQLYASNQIAARKAESIGWANVSVSPVQTGHIQIPGDGEGIATLDTSIGVSERRPYTCTGGVVTLGGSPGADATLVASGSTIAAEVSAAGRCAVTITVIHGAT